MVCSSFDDKLIACWQNILTDPNAQSIQLENPATSVDCSTSLVATASSDTIQLFNFEMNELVHQIRCASEVNTIKWSPNASEIVSTHSGSRNEVKLWQVDSI